MNGNVISMRKTDRFFICTGHVTESGDVVEKERVGVAYLKPESTLFRIRLWMFPKGDYFLARESDDHFRYTALSCDEYVTQAQETKTQWHKIGHGEVLGNFIRIRLHLFSDDFYLLLFPKPTKPEEALDAA